jgi:hypothetical protein
VIVPPATGIEPDVTEAVKATKLPDSVVELAGDITMVVLFGHQEGAVT